MNNLVRAIVDSCKIEVRYYNTKRMPRVEFERLLTPTTRPNGAMYVPAYVFFEGVCYLNELHLVVTYYAGDMFVRLRAEHFPKTGDVLLETVTVYDPLYNLVVYVDASGINGLPMRQYTYGAGTVQGFCDILAQRIDKHREKMMNAADAYLLTFTNIGVP